MARRRNGNGSSDDIQESIIRTLIEIGGPVTFGNVRKGTPDKTEQLVYYHLQKLTKDGIVLYEDGPDGRVYSLQPVFYNKDLINKVGAITELLLDYIGKGLTSPEVNVVSVYFTLVALSQKD